MGLWWKDIETIPQGEGLSFKGDSYAHSQSIPLLWRLTWERRLLRVDGFDTACFVYFASDDAKMRYRQAIITPYICIRIGPGDVTFFAFDCSDQLRVLHLTDLTVFHDNRIPYFDRENVVQVHLRDREQVTYL